jgi:Mn-dependent DtxR family transcriptional regulator
MEKLFNEKRLNQVKEFVGYLTNDWSNITNKQIRSKFFNNSRSFTDEALKTLEENSIIEVERGGKVYVNSKWIMNSNRYRLFSGSSAKTVSEKTFFNEEEGRIVKFKYRGIREITETFTQSDKDIVRKIKDGLSESLSESTFIEICSTYGMSKEKSWYFYSKIV